jgi:hypothetical protein
MYTGGAPSTTLEDSDGSLLEHILPLSVMRIAWIEEEMYRVWLGQVSPTGWMNGKPSHRTIIPECLV